MESNYEGGPTWPWLIILPVAIVGCYIIILSLGGEATDSMWVVFTICTILAGALWAYALTLGEKSPTYAWVLWLICLILFVVGTLAKWSPVRIIPYLGFVIGSVITLMLKDVEHSPKK